MKNNSASRGMLAPLAVLLALHLGGCTDGSDNTAAGTTTTPATHTPTATGTPREVTGERIRDANREPGNWLSHGRTYDEQRYSPLDQINDSNVARELGLAWYFDLDSDRGQEATPIVVDGVMYLATAWSMVKALDAKSGALLWAYDPRVSRSWVVNACCDAVNRGVAVWGDSVYVGTLDGRLVALDRSSGEVTWEIQTTDPDKPYTITGAPRVVKGKVIIGNGGAEFGVRGYVSAYDAATGEMIWRFYTVPGDPDAGFEQPELETAATTWNGEWWRQGGGGTVWDSMAYDPGLDLLYIGVGNGSPWVQELRSPGGGDNLFLSSIVALRPDTGTYVWHYQTTPGDNWDYTATQHIILAELTIDGRERSVLMQAPKNGFFYVLDRETGELLSAKNFIEVNWATGIDIATGRPLENPAARYAESGQPWLAMPGPAGAHNWQPMSYSPRTGLVYIPVIEAGYNFTVTREFAPTTLRQNTGLNMVATSLPEDPQVRDAIIQSVSGHLAAWDPVGQREVWRVQYREPWNGGILSTAGNLVIQGNTTGEFAIYRGDTGEKLWAMETGTTVIAAPISYAVDGEQYLAVAAGWGGVFGLIPGQISLKAGPKRNLSRVLAFRLNGNARLPPTPAAPMVALDPPPMFGDEALVDTGRSLYHDYCGTCHGGAAVSSGLLTDLRYSAMLKSATAWREVVGAGALEDKGMVSFAEHLDTEEMEAIRAYVIARAQMQLEEEQTHVAGE